MRTSCDRFAGLRKCSWIFAAAIFIFTGSSTLFAQVLPSEHWDLTGEFKSYIHESWTTEHGLPQNIITAIAQTPDGYLWLGTQLGLVRFDGVSFKTFDRYNTPQMVNEFVRRLAVAGDSSLWVGTDHGGLISYRDGIIAASKLTDSLSVGGVRVLCAGTGRTLWAAIPGLGVWKNDGNQWSPVVSSRPLTSSRAAFADLDGTLWLGEQGALVHIIGDSTVWYDSRQGMPGSQVLSIDRAPNGALLIGTLQDGLYRLLKNKFVPLPEGGELQHADVTAMCNDPHGGVWVGCFDKGLYFYDGASVKQCIANVSSPPLRILSIAYDNEGSLWFGTSGDGLHRFRRSAVRYLQPISNEISSQVWAVLLRGGEMWLGTREHGLRCIVGGKIVVPPMPKKLASATISSLLDAHDGSLWVGCEDGLFRRSAGTTTEIMMPDGRPFSNVYALLQDHTGTIWIGGEGLFTLKNNSPKKIEGMPSSFSVNYLLEDRDHNLWIGSDANGVGLLSNNKISFFTKDSGVTSNTILCLYEGTGGEIWAGTEGGGLSIYKNGRWGSFTTDNGLIDNYVNTIIPADDTTIWMSTNRGLFGAPAHSIIDVAEGRAARCEGTSIESHDGLQTIEFGGGLQTCSAKTADGTLWFVSLKGLVGYNPRERKQKLPAPQVHIESIVVNGQRQQASNGAEFDPGVASIQFEYAGLSYINPPAMRYRYSLEGFDKKWIDGGSRHEVMYTNLAPGTYIFRVLAANSDGVWSTRDASLRFTILPHFWQTGLFNFFAFVVLISVILGIFRIRVRQILKREEDLKRRIDEALVNIKMLHGLIPICANCKKIRDDKGFWNDVAQYISEHSEAVMTHGLCPECSEKLYGEELRRIRAKKESGGSAASS